LIERGQGIPTKKAVEKRGQNGRAMATRTGGEKRQSYFLGRKKGGRKKKQSHNEPGHPQLNARPEKEKVAPSKSGISSKKKKKRKKPKKNPITAG